MAEWKKVVVSGSNISELNNDAGFLASVGSGIVSGSSQISFTGITNVPSGLVSGSSQISLGGDLSGTANSATVTKVQNVALESGEVNQLANIGSTTISSTQWGYLGVMNQNVRTTDAVTFSTVNTGQGANELYAMNQNVRTTDAVTFSTVNTGQGANELYAMDQNVRTTDGVAFNGVVSTGRVAFYNVDDVLSFNFSPTDSITEIATASVAQNLTVGGDLIVQGDLTYLNTTNTLVEDQFILLGSGSGEGTDKGIIFDGTGGDTGVGVAFFWDGGVARLSYTTAASHTATAVTPEAYIPLVFDVTGAGHTADTNVGNIKIEDNEAYIYV
jgi:hypothetical protein